MATASDLLRVALGEVGYRAYEDPLTGSRYGRWLAAKWGEPWLAGSSTSIWWCCMFVSWCLDQAGVAVRGFPTYNTDLALSKVPPQVPREAARPGDVIIWDWDGNGATDHIGIVLEHEPGALGRIVTVEGNYGNAVAVVDRSGCWSLVRAVIRPQYSNREDEDMFTDEDRELLRRVDRGINTPQDASGRGVMASMPDRLAWGAAKQEGQIESERLILERVGALEAKLDAVLERLAN